jgi:hypothetical protein
MSLPNCNGRIAGEKFSTQRKEFGGFDMLCGDILLYYS